MVALPTTANQGTPRTPPGGRFSQKAAPRLRSMQFDLPPELAELQAMARKLAQEKVAPRAREIDTTSAYPQDLFEVFRDSGLLGLVIPEEYGGGGAGIMGLTLAIEEVAKYSNTAALMLLLTR